MHKIYLKIILPGKYFHCALPFFHFQSIFLSFERNVLTRFRQTRRFSVSVNPYQSDLRFIYKKVAWIRIILWYLLSEQKIWQKNYVHDIFFCYYVSEERRRNTRKRYNLPSDVLILIFLIVITAVFFLNNNNNNISFICMTIIM